MQLNTKKKLSAFKIAENLNRQFSKEDIPINNIHMKRYSTSLIIKELKIKTKMIYSLTPEGMAKIKITRNNKCEQEF